MNYEEKLAELRTKKGIISDMDGVIYHGNQLLPGVREFVDWLYKEKKEFLFLTNASERTPLELKQKLARLGLDVDESHFYTSAMATAKFLDQQAPGCSAYVIGSAGLLNALHDVGITMNDVNPDYVVVGETSAYNFMMLTKAMQLVEAGAKLIATNSDISGPGRNGQYSCVQSFSGTTGVNHRQARLFCRETESADYAYRLKTIGRSLCGSSYDWR
jgi:NagD protein